MLQLPFLFLLQPRLLQLVVDGPHYGAARDAHAQERGEPDAEVAERALPAPKPAKKNRKSHTHAGVSLRLLRVRPRMDSGGGGRVRGSGRAAK